MNDIYFEKVWAMPNGNTFTIKPIKEFVEAEVNKGGVIIDPFANTCKYGTITNDLNPDMDTDYHLDALEFLKTIKTESADLVLYDPPYSITQATTLYKAYGKKKLEINVANMMTNILIVSHGGSKNDTLVTLEYKINGNESR